MIVVDTGSDDGTPEIALQHSAKVAYFHWCDDFSSARHFAIYQASGEWILPLDADEELAVTSDDFRQTLAATTQFLVYSVVQRWQEAAAAFEMALSFDADFTPAKQSLEMTKQFLTSQN